MTSLPIKIDIKDYSKIKEVHAKLIEKIRPMAKFLDEETKRLIEELNEFYFKFEDSSHENIVLPNCFNPESCLNGMCTSDISVCKYVSVLQKNPLAIRVPNNKVSLFIDNGWKLESKDVRDDEFIRSSNYSILVPVSEG